MKINKKRIAVVLLALGVIGRILGGETTEQPKAEQKVVEQPTKVEQPKAEVNKYGDQITALAKNYTYQRDEVFADAKSLATAKSYGGKWQVPHMRLVGIQGNLVGLESDNGCKMIVELPANDVTRSVIIRQLENNDENLVLVTLTRIGGRDDDGRFIYCGTIEYATETVIGGIK